MVSERKWTANGANARASTGPKTAGGKSRSARNALRHGLSLPIVPNLAARSELFVLAREFVTPSDEPRLLELAYRVVEAQLDLVRIRRARHELLTHTLYGPEYETITAESIKTKPLFGTTRPGFTGSMFQTAQRVAYTKLQESEKFAAVFSELARELAAMDRYERHALSRRKSAIRDLDAARREYKDYNS